MKYSLVRNISSRAKAMACGLAAVGAAAALTSCGGGGGGSEDDSPPTVRPKTMEGVVLTLDGSASFEFLRSAGSSGAVYNNDVETGTFIYTPLLASDVLKFYDNLQGDKSNFRYPTIVNAASYTYHAINDSSGVLRLTGTGVIDTTYTGTGSTILNGSWIRLFYSYSPASLVRNTNLAEIAITFSSNGVFVSSDTVTLRLPESPVVGTLDTVRIPTALRLAIGTPVPPNYNPTFDPNRPSRIAPATLANRLLSAVNSASATDPSKDFTIQFVPEATIPGASLNEESTEVGHGLLYVYDPAAVPPGPSAVGIALDYTWKRIAGTDKGDLVLSNVPDNPALPFDSILNGTITLSFMGTQSGTYSSPAGADVTGSFTLLGTPPVTVIGTGTGN